MKLWSYQFSRREKVLLALLAALVSVFYAYKIVWGQQLAAYRQLKNQLQVSQERLIAARQATTLAPELARQAGQAEGEWEATRLRLGFTLRGTAAFLAAAQPEDKSLQILSFQPRPVEKREPFSVYPYAVSVSGPYPAVRDYLARLESLPALTIIHNLKIASRPGSSTLVEASFVIDLYNLGDRVAAPAAVALVPTGRADDFNPPAGVVNPPGAGEKPVVNPAAVPGGMTSDAPPAATSTAGPAGRTRPPDPAPQVPATPVTTGPPPAYTLPRLVAGRLVAGPAYKDPPADRATWLGELRVLRNAGPFFLLDRPAALAGAPYEHSVGVNLSKEQARSELRVDLGGRYTRLQGYAGIDDSFASSRGKAVLTILADERQLYQGPLLAGHYPPYLELPLARVQQLTFSLEWQEDATGEGDQLLVILADLHFSPDP
ncbi:MAG: hypothetical protein PWQ18_965 [Clostridia bacterium]|nr:hypothetical protein [Clostridia bacterium]